MSNKPLLTVGIVVQDQKDVIETTLTSLYELAELHFELFVIDDASQDESTEIIQSVLDYYQHEHTFYYDHQQRMGRGNSLNEILLQCNTDLFWAPESIHTIEEEQLIDSLERLSETVKCGIIQRNGLPQKPADWRSLIKKNRWPTDGLFLWNLPALNPSDRNFNSYLNAYHGLEMAARVGSSSFIQADNSCFLPSSMEETPSPSPAMRQELLFTLLRSDISSEQRNATIHSLQTLETKDRPLSERDFDIELLNEAIAMKKDGRFNAALEKLEEVLEERPSHPAAKQLKIEILEKKRRFVEASELKHEISRSAAQKKKEGKEEKEEKEADPKEETATAGSEQNKNSGISLIIPTAIHGKAALEHCLMSISEHCDTSDIRLIVIDNASVDDTHDYLEELQEKNFLDCTVITNNQNIGFAASVNQGLEKADTPYACIMHNDVELNNDALKALKNLMETHPEYALVGPATDKTLNPDQAIRNIEATSPGLLATEYIDSFCMMLRTETELRLDEAYELAFFEDIDLCFQARADDYEVGIAPHIEVKHYFGTTTFPLDLDTESKHYWKNVAYFNEKWEIEKFSEQELKSLSTFDQLLALDELVNPLFPEEEIKKEFDRLLTDELKTEILKTEHDPDILCKLVHLFMVMQKRDIMRQLEDRLEEVYLPASLIYQLVRFYYERNIYSRCLHYLDQLEPQNESLRADLYRLAIHVENKDFDEAIPMLKHLLEHAPANPTLYQLAGDIHQFNDNQEEADSFHNLAKQINPFKFDESSKDAFGFKN